MREVDIAFVVDNCQSNSLGRVYSLWLLAERGGFTSVTVAASGQTLWKPLADTQFADTVVRRASCNGTPSRREISPSVIICVKPMPAAVRLSVRWSEMSRRPIIMDIDEPDIEAGLSYGKPYQRVAKSLLRPLDTTTFLRARKLAATSTTTVSNPYLMATYGGEVIPHVRQVTTETIIDTSATPTVAFVGTNRGHKGLGILRRSVADLQKSGFKLVVTDSAPPDAKPWERWLGQTTMAEGLALVKSSSIVALPSLETPFSRGQLPVKLIDAMSLGRAVVASDLPAMAWAMGDTGLMCEPGDVGSLTACLEHLSNEGIRRVLGAKARDRAAAMFSVDANASNFSRVIENVR